MLSTPRQRPTTSCPFDRIQRIECPTKFLANLNKKGRGCLRRHRRGRRGRHRRGRRGRHRRGRRGRRRKKRPLVPEAPRLRPQRNQKRGRRDKRKTTTTKKKKKKKKTKTKTPAGRREEARRRCSRRRRDRRERLGGAVRRRRTKKRPRGCRQMVGWCKEAPRQKSRRRIRLGRFEWKWKLENARKRNATRFANNWSR